MTAQLFAYHGGQFAKVHLLFADGHKEWVKSPLTTAQPYAKWNPRLGEALFNIALAALEDYPGAVKVLAVELR
jgi:prepilin-type processing-associated H-X9-DG protein